MTPEAIRIAVAEEMGWVIPAGCTNYRIQPNGQKVFFNPLTTDDVIPDYPDDLNACVEMEATLSWDESGKMNNLLCVIVPQDVRIWQATALQRCEAFLKVKGKWIDQ